MGSIDAPIELKLSTEEFAKRWAVIEVDKLHQALDKYGIGKLDGRLWRSILSQVKANNGDVEKVITRFLQYGRFLDMGVGRGVPIGAAGSGAFSAARNADGTLKQYRRRPKHWYSKTYYAEVQRFKELFADIFNKQVPGQIVEAFSTTIQISA